jgi:hypothetical protein
MEASKVVPVGNYAQLQTSELSLTYGLLHYPVSRGYWNICLADIQEIR